jgi:hypothetical protein
MAEDQSSAVQFPDYNLERVSGLLLVIHMLVLFVLLMAVPPVPIVPLSFALEAAIIDVSLVSLLQPASVSLVLALVPIVVVLMIRVIHTSFSFSFLALVPLVIILGRSHCKGT